MSDGPKRFFLTPDMDGDRPDGAWTRSKTQQVPDTHGSTPERSTNDDSYYSLLPARQENPPVPALVTPTLDSMSNTTPHDDLSDSGALREMLWVQLQLLEFMTTERQTPTVVTAPEVHTLAPLVETPVAELIPVSFQMTAPDATPTTLTPAMATEMDSTAEPHLTSTWQMGGRPTTPYYIY